MRRNVRYCRWLERMATVATELGAQGLLKQGWVALSHMQRWLMLLWACICTGACCMRSLAVDGAKAAGRSDRCVLQHIRQLAPCVNPGPRAGLALVGFTATCGGNGAAAEHSPTSPTKHSVWPHRPAWRMRDGTPLAAVSRAAARAGCQVLAERPCAPTTLRPAVACYCSGYTTTDWAARRLCGLGLALHALC